MYIQTVKYREIYSLWLISDQSFTNNKNNNLSYLLLFNYLLCLYTEVKISCNVPSVRLHEDTFLTCFLPEDVGQTKKDFTVYKYSDTETPG